MKRLLPLLFSLLVLESCNDDVLVTVPSRLVVEGWIENNGYPIVLLSRTMPISTEPQDASNLKDYMINFARVAIADGKDTIVLTGRVDKSYFPPYIYTTTKLRGKVGRTYSLIVDYKDYHATAQTTIPTAPAVDSLRVTPVADSDSLFQISIYFTDNPTEKNYYQLFTRVGQAQKQYLSAFMGCIDDAVLDGASEVPVYKGHPLQDSLYTPYYSLHDTVGIKFCQTDEFGFNFWKEFNQSRSTSDNVLISTSSNLPSNIEGGIGYWCGYGVTTQYVIVGDNK